MRRTSSSSKRSDPRVEPMTTNSNSPSGSCSGEPQQPQQPQTNEAMGDQRLDLTPPPHTPSKIRRLRCRIMFWALMVPFTTLWSLYVYQVLIADHPHVGRLFFSPTNTNLVIKILAQVLALLIHALFVDIFDVLRWQLASRDRGVPIPTFLELSGATTWLGVFSLAVIKGRHHIWGLHRLLLPVLGIFIGAILKVNASFENRVTPSNSSVPAFAGLALMDKRVLQYIPTSVLCIYYLAWIPNILGVSKYVTGLSSSNCTANCTAVFLPGGPELARVFGQNMNATLLEGNIFGDADADAVLLNNATGIGLEFSSPDNNFKFDIGNDCQLYGSRNDSVQICVTTRDSSLIVGWTICPTNIFTAQKCTADLSWSSSQPNQQTSLSAFRQRATTVYERKNLSIISFEIVSPPDPISFDPNDFKAIWGKIFNPGPDATSNDAVMVNAFMYGLGWYLRLYEDRFRDDRQDPLNLLQNFLTIPIQFSTAALQFSNATLQAVAPGSGIFAMPSDLEATASGAQITPRFTGRLWTVWTFIAICTALVSWAGCILGWVLFTKTPLLTDPSAFPEWDIVSKSGSGAEQDSTRCTLPDLAQLKGLTNAGSWAIPRALRGKRARVVEVQCRGQNTYYFLLLEPEDMASEEGIALERSTPT